MRARTSKVTLKTFSARRKCLEVRWHCRQLRVRSQTSQLEQRAYWVAASTNHGPLFRPSEYKRSRGRLTTQTQVVGYSASVTIFGILFDSAETTIVQGRCMVPFCVIIIIMLTFDVITSRSKRCHRSTSNCAHLAHAPCM